MLCTWLLDQRRYILLSSSAVIRFLRAICCLSLFTSSWSFSRTRSLCSTSPHTACGQEQKVITNIPSCTTQKSNTFTRKIPGLYLVVHCRLGILFGCPSLHHLCQRTRLWLNMGGKTTTFLCFIEKLLQRTNLTHLGDYIACQYWEIFALQVERWYLDKKAQLNPV